MTPPDVTTAPIDVTVARLEEVVANAEQAHRADREARQRIIVWQDREHPDDTLDGQTLDWWKTRLDALENEAKVGVMDAAVSVRLVRDRVPADVIEKFVDRVLAVDASGEVRSAMSADPATGAAFDRLDDSEWHERFRQLDAEVMDAAGPDEWANLPSSIDDSHMAGAFARHIMGRYLYVETWRRWLRWDDRRWAHDDTGRIHEEARQFVLDLGMQMFQLEVDRRRQAQIIRYRSKPRLDAIESMARHIDGIAARPDEFDRDPDLLNVHNGIVNLRTREVTPHDPAKRMTKLAGAAYVPDATHRDVDQALGVVDDDVRDWLISFAGYAATGHTSEDLVAVLDGNGANGKTTLLEAFGAALGDYAAPAPAALIMQTGRDEHPTLKTTLQGRRLVSISETEENGSIRGEQLKALTGGDQITARVMRGNYYTFTPSHTLVVATNHRPYINATEHAMWRRLRLVPFPHTYRPADQCQPGDRPMDKGLRRRLALRAQREAMLAWLVIGAYHWYEYGLPHCSTIDTATAEWRRSEDVILRFIDDELTFDPSGQIQGATLYALYEDWCRRERRPAKTPKNFVPEFMAHETVVAAGVTKVLPKGKVFYRGVRTTA